ncbi:MAG: hypothetical protein ACRDLB_17160 [Actinomycetota bacterium]
MANPPTSETYVELEERPPSLLLMVLRATAATVTGILLFFFLGLSVVGWKVCCDFDTREFQSRAEAVDAVVEGMGREWPFQSIEVRSNNSDDLLIERHWMGVTELRAIVANADHERAVAEDNDLEATFSPDAEWVFHSSYERRNGVLLKSGLVAVVVAAAMVLLLRLTRPRPK